MQNAVSSIIAVLGLDVTFVGEVEADTSEPWCFVVEASPAERAWTATRRHAVWVSRGEEAERLMPGELALVRGATDTTRITVRTQLEATEAPPDPRSDPLFALMGLLPASGVVHGIARFGSEALADEVLALPDLHVAHERDGVLPITDPVLAVLTSEPHAIGSAVGATLARALVLVALGVWEPPILRDRSLRRTIEHVLAAPTAPLVPDLPRPRRCSPSTLHRRFVDTTGLSPGRFIRWWQSVRIRALLAAGETEAEVAAAVGHRDVHDLRRSLSRAESVRVSKGSRRHPWLI